MMLGRRLGGLWRGRGGRGGFECWVRYFEEVLVCGRYLDGIIAALEKGCLGPWGGRVGLENLWMYGYRETVDLPFEVSHT